MKDYRKILTSLQISIWEAEWFIDQEIKVDFWTGRKGGLQIAFFSIKSLGFDISFIKRLANPYQ